LSIIFKDYAASIPKNEIIDLSITRKVFDLIRPETKDTKPLYLQVSMEVLKNQLRDVTGIILVMQDVTDMRREEMMKQDFLGLISHKLRTPVAAIFGNAQMLLDKKYFGMLSDKQKTVVEAVLKESRVLIDLIDRLLKYVEMNRVSPDLKMETIELCGYLNSLAASMIEQANDKKIEFSIDCADKSFMIRSHKPSLESIFKNLIENAFKFNDKEILKVDIGIKRAAQKVEISISDNGRGIPPEDEDRIFEVFYQIEKDFTGNTCGAGLGLPLVKRLVRACGGDINMRSEIGRGTTFVIMLPDAR
jgi:signal transduction histidine kinase